MKVYGLVSQQTVTVSARLSFLWLLKSSGKVQAFKATLLRFTPFTRQCVYSGYGTYPGGSYGAY